MTTTLINKFEVAPPSGTEEISLPLTLFDMNWVVFHPVRRLLFYQLPCSKDQFMAEILPLFQNSLSVALKHYLPLAGKIHYTTCTDSNSKPILRYLHGDSVTLSIFESGKDFHALVGNHPRDSDLFYDFIPQLPPYTEEGDYTLLHLLAVQITLFDGIGICIGVSNHHAAGDAASIFGFLKSWTSIAKLGGEDQLLIKPIYDRSKIQDSRDQASSIWKRVRGFLPHGFGGITLPTGRVRATHTFSQSDIKKLKDTLSAKKPGFPHLSSFVVVAAYLWTCVAQSLEIEGEAEDPKFLLFPADCRSRIDPPLPENYFGNCLSYGLAEVPRKELVGEQGFFAAAEAISFEIKNKLSDKERIVNGTENALVEIPRAIKKGCLSVAGSARVDTYGLDFGWGGPVKYESPSIDQDRYAFSLCRDSNGGLEVGLSLPADKMALVTAKIAAGPPP